MRKIVLKGKKIVGGKAAGEAIVSHEPISFIGGFDPKTGVVTEKGHELEGQRVTGKILVFSTGKGSTGGSYRIYEMVHQKTAPIAFVVVERDPISVIGCIMGNIPAIDQVEKDPTEIISTGDFVEIDADLGVITITKKN